MKLFSDSDSRKRFMKNGLPYLLSIVWIPIIWMTVSALFGRILFMFTGSLLIAQFLVVVISFGTLFLLLRVFMYFSGKFYGDSH
ncbi:hypothetical protein [Chlorobium phaeobacteroides]|jgi:hypothetical protein|uniref:Uncharacterized protein n=1 Tax=Chlorobium phaeobacteroides (strain DSM 266 / SMG 266 / 2430) TaxID=290317 RepID=A1BF31_CHLPD|nr:hypothetical protein [Chlorobium phaeobacteroides]ABL65008.1 conserved hypothetical protein [Chlorobium phaeobacteroides DSM 266]MBV5326915.1 hypothetical protein [Chlorobium sp.]